MGSPEEYLSRVTMSIRVMTAGDGYRYLLNSVVYGDGDHDASSALTRYYLEAGTPPGTWLGSGLPGLAGDIATGATVSEEQLGRLLGAGQDPTTGEQLGRPYRKFATRSERVQRRLEQLPENLSAESRAAQQALIEAEEANKPTGAPVSGFDLTFSVPKSVSTLWAVADGGTQALIARCVGQNPVADTPEACEAGRGVSSPRWGVATLDTIRGRQERQERSRSPRTSRNWPPQGCYAGTIPVNPVIMAFRSLRRL